MGIDNKYLLGSAMRGLDPHLQSVTSHLTAIHAILIQQSPGKFSKIDEKGFDAKVYLQKGRENKSNVKMMLLTFM